MDDFNLPHLPECLDGFRQAAPKVRFDPAKYAHHLAEYDLNEEQQLRLMRTVWDFMVMMADAGYEIDSVSLAAAEAPPPRIEAAPNDQLKDKEERSP